MYWYISNFVHSGHCGRVLYILSRFIEYNYEFVIDWSTEHSNRIQFFINRLVFNQILNELFSPFSIIAFISMCLWSGNLQPDPISHRPSLSTYMLSRVTSPVPDGSFRLRVKLERPVSSTFVGIRSICFLNLKVGLCYKGVVKILIDIRRGPWSVSGGAYERRSRTSEHYFLLTTIVCL